VVPDHEKGEDQQGGAHGAEDPPGYRLEHQG
jgi:hypothetical protein